MNINQYKILAYIYASLEFYLHNRHLQAALYFSAPRIPFSFANPGGL